MYRKQSALSQDEVAYLLGRQSGAKVCRYERFKREPGLQTALAYVVMFQRPISELFPGLYEEVAAEVRARAGKLAEKMKHDKTNPSAARRRQVLAAIIDMCPMDKEHQS